MPELGNASVVRVTSQPQRNSGKCLEKPAFFGCLRSPATTESVTGCGPERREKTTSTPVTASGIGTNPDRGRNHDQEDREFDNHGAMVGRAG
jgi:hypothetical protein